MMRKVGEDLLTEKYFTLLKDEKFKASFFGPFTDELMPGTQTESKTESVTSVKECNSTPFKKTNIRTKGIY